MTPCGAEPGPSGICRVSPVLGSSWPNAPARCAVYQIVPSGAGATSCGPEPGGTAYSWIASGGRAAVGVDAGTVTAGATRGVADARAGVAVGPVVAVGAAVVGETAT